MLWGGVNTCHFVALLPFLPLYFVREGWERHGLGKEKLDLMFV